MDSNFHYISTVLGDDWFFLGTLYRDVHPLGVYSNGMVTWNGSGTRDQRFQRPVL